MIRFEITYLDAYNNKFTANFDNYDWTTYIAMFSKEEMFQCFMENFSPKKILEIKEISS